jgi:hypothetical protein
VVYTGCCDPKESDVKVTTADLAAYLLRQCRAKVHAVNSPGLIAITGASCSGKSLLARSLAWRARNLGFEVTLHHLTEYQNPAAWPQEMPRDRAYYAHAFDMAGFIDAVHKDAATRRDSTPGFVVAEGEFLLRKQFNTLWDYSVWIDTEDDLVVHRARTRDLENMSASELNAIRSPDSVEQVYRLFCLPALRLHLEQDAPAKHASIVVASLEDGWEVDVPAAGDSDDERLAAGEADD